MAHAQTRALPLAALLLTLSFASPAALCQMVDVWLTTHDQTAKLRQQPAVCFSPTVGSSNVIIVDENQTYQPIEGFGAAMTDSAAWLLNEVADPDQLSATMADLFSRSGNGIGISFLRNPMGASDLARYHYSFDDGPADPDLTNFSIAHDEADIIPLISQSKQLNPDLKIMANPWSPPGWMKTSGSLIGGSLLPAMYTPFANYFVKYIQAYAAEGIPIDYISLQNEPLFVPGNYPGMSMPAATQTTVLRDYVLPALTASQITTKVLIYDHNYDRPDYPDTVLGDPIIAASEQVAGTAWHEYGGTPGVMWSLNARFPGKGNYHTELSGGTFVSDQIKTDFENITQVMRNWGRTFVKWSLALDQNHGPHAGGCGTCTALVTVNNLTGNITYPIEYYTLGHFSKFVYSGAYHIYSSNGSGVVTAAFMNPDGSKALVAFNDGPGEQAFQVQWGSQQFSYSLPGLSAATFVWQGNQDDGHTVAATSQIRASSFNDNMGLQTQNTTDTLGGYNLGYTSNDSFALYRNVDFGTGVNSVSARVASAGAGGRLEFHLDSPTGQLIGSVNIPITGGWQTWTTVSGAVSGSDGIHDLYAVFKGTTSIGNLNWFQFNSDMLGSRQESVNFPIREISSTLSSRVNICPSTHVALSP